MSALPGSLRSNHVEDRWFGQRERRSDTLAYPLSDTYFGPRKAYGRAKSRSRIDRSCLHAVALLPISARSIERKFGLSDDSCGMRTTISPYSLPCSAVA
jgi:hypothetical protein